MRPRPGQADCDASGSAVVTGHINANASAAIKSVIASATIERITAIAAQKAVIATAAATIQIVIAAATIERIIAHVAIQPIVAARTGQTVIEAGAKDILDIEQRVGAIADGVLRGGQAEIDGDPGQGTTITGNINAVPAVEIIIARIADEGIIAAKARYRVIAAGSAQAVIAGGAGENRHDCNPGL